MQILSNAPLQAHHTFGLAVSARYLAVAQAPEQVLPLLQNPRFEGLPVLFLGGGSNVLFTQNFEGLVVKIGWQQKQVLKQNAKHVWLAVHAGHNWHELVLHCVQQGWGGIENLALIPGTMGAAPMQNIGAYGVEIKQVFEHLEAIELATGKVRTFTKEECAFGYRESIFKKELKGQYVISRVVLRLDKQPTFYTEYGAIKDTLAQMQVKQLSLQAISQAVIHIRQSKLPNPAQIGNAGSFFKNPVIPAAHYQDLKQHYPNLPGYAQGQAAESPVKVPAAWLIDQAGWKGHQRGNIGVHKKQALVLVNHGGGQGAALWQLAQDIQASVKQKYGVALQPEVNII